MIKKLENKNMGKSDLGWLQSSFHFSFAEYFNPFNMNFGVLRVLNDDIIHPETGFGTHPHENMEIVSYVVNGKLTHKDSMNNERTLERGEVQYMSAGTGVFHSEYNLDKEEDVRLLQIWILPDAKGYTPNYGEFKFKWEDRKGAWLHMVSSVEGEAPVKIHQDMNIFTIELEKGEEATFDISEKRQGYLVQIEGTGDINGVVLNHGDAMEAVEENLKIKATEKSHYILLEMKKHVQ